jgi:hypothetical protein
MHSQNSIGWKRSANTTEVDHDGRTGTLMLEQKWFKKLAAHVTDKVFATLSLIHLDEYHWIRDAEHLATWQLIVLDALVDALATHLTRMAARRLALAEDKPVTDVLLQQSEELRATLHTGVTALVTTEVARLLASREPAS